MALIIFRDSPNTMIFNELEEDVDVECKLGVTNLICAFRASEGLDGEPEHGQHHTINSRHHCQGA